MATVNLIPTELTTISVWIGGDGRPVYAKVPALDTLSLSAVERRYPAPRGCAWEQVTPFMAYIVRFGHGDEV